MNVPSDAELDAAGARLAARLDRMLLTLGDANKEEGSYPEPWRRRRVERRIADRLGGGD